MAQELSKSLEDYLEAILMICNDKGVARVKDIAARLGVKAASVTEALHHLSRLGLIHYEPYSVIRLTDDGRDRASEILNRHHVLTEFLNGVIGIELPHAEELACILEHVIKYDDFQKFERFTTMVRSLEPNGSLLEALERGDCHLSRG